MDQNLKIDGYLITRMEKTFQNFAFKPGFIKRKGLNKKGSNQFQTKEVNIFHKTTITLSKKEELLKKWKLEYDRLKHERTFEELLIENNKELENLNDYGECQEFE